MSGNSIENVLNEVVWDVLDEVKRQRGEIENICDEIPLVDSSEFNCNTYDLVGDCGYLTDCIVNSIDEEFDDYVSNFCDNYNREMEPLKERLTKSYEKLDEKIQDILPTLTKKLSNIKMVVSENEIIKDLQKQLKEKDEMVKRLKRKVVMEECWEDDETREEYTYEGEIFKFMGHHKYLVEGGGIREGVSYATIERKDDGWYRVEYDSCDKIVKEEYMGNVFEWERWNTANMFGIFVRD